MDDADVLKDNSKRVTQGVIEAIVIALITGAASSLVTVKVLERDIAALQTDVSRIHADLDKLRDDVYIPRSRVGVSTSGNP